MTTDYYYKMKLDFQNSKDQTARFHLTLFIAFVTAVIAVLTKTETLTYLSKSISTVASGGLLFSLFSTIIAASWLQKIHSLISEENAHMKYLQESSTKMNDYFKFVNEQVRLEKKNNRSKSGFIVPLNQTDDGIPRLIFQGNIILLIAMTVIILVAGIFQIA